MIDVTGLCVSALRDDMGAIIAWIFNAISWSAEKGARNFLYAATQNTTPGAFINHCHEQPVSTFVASSIGRTTQEKYWKETLSILKGTSVRSELEGILSR
jgi:retinol dehydrogenase-12